MAPPPLPRPSLLHRLLDQRTVWQKALLAVGAVAGVIVAVAGAVGVVRPLFDRAPDALSVGAVPHVIANQSADADALVRALDAAAGIRPVLLDHHILGQPGPANVTLNYNCGDSGACSVVRLEVGGLAGYAVVSGGVWLKGCYSILRDGNGYGADHLDLELTMVGASCPT